MLTKEYVLQNLDFLTKTQRLKILDTILTTWTPEYFRLFVSTVKSVKAN